MLSNSALDGLDGELTVLGERFNDFNHNQSQFMTQSGQPKFVLNVFDDISLAHKPAEVRKRMTAVRVHSLAQQGYPVVFCEQRLVHSADELRAMYHEYRAKGYEGLIAMAPQAKYKHGRSTLLQQIMMKLKPCEDDEAVITGFEVVMHNMDAGNSKCKENLVPGDRVGVVLATWQGKAIRIGSGFDHTLAKHMWDNQEQYKGKTVTFKYMEKTPYGMPRSPIWKGLRSKEDMS